VRAISLDGVPVDARAYELRVRGEPVLVGTLSEVETLKALADAAAATGWSFDQMRTALADLQHAMMREWLKEKR
jgi:molybdenum-dependent DNA-binding transcriptional regulator ModE